METLPMKTLLILISLLTFTAQAQTYYDPVTNVQSGVRLTTTNDRPYINGRLVYVDGSTNTATSNRTGLLSSNDWQSFTAKYTPGTTNNGAGWTNIPLTAIVGLGDAQTNAILRGGRVVAWTTNQFLTTNTVLRALPGNFTNIAGMTYTVLTGSTTPYWRYAGGATNWESFPGGYLVTTGIVEVAFKDSDLGSLGTPINPTITNITIYSMQRPDLFGRTNHLVGQTLEVDVPGYARQVANKEYVDTAVAGVNYVQNGGIYLVGADLNFDSQWSAAADTNGVHFKYLGIDTLKIDAPQISLATITSIKKTNQFIFVSFWTNGVTSVPTPHWSYDIAYPKWQVLSSYTNTYPTVTGTNYTMTFPLPNTNRAFIRVAFQSANPNFASLTALLSTPPRTITNATDTTWGKGSGLLTWDTNYVYISVGSNLWKRAAVSSW